MGLQKYRAGEECVWMIKGETYSTPIEQGTCPMCGALDTITALPKPILEQQPDDTTHVCHPALGGCNHGFCKTPALGLLHKKGT